MQHIGFTAAATVAVARNFSYLRFGTESCPATRLSSVTDLEGFVGSFTEFYLTDAKQQVQACRFQSIAHVSH
jgi:hypothetical protein